MHPTPSPNPLQQVVGPSPTPLTASVSSEEVDGRGYVVLRMMTPVGVSIFYLDDAAAKGVGGALVASAAQSGTGIVLPPRPRLV